MNRRKGLLQRIVESEKEETSLESGSQTESLADERLIELQARLDSMRGQVEAILSSINQPHPA